MSIHARGGKWQVKWRENGRQRSRTFLRKGDADDFDIAVKRSLQLGPTLARELERNTLTLDAFVRTGFRTHAATLSAATRKHYRWALTNHLTELAHEPLLTIDVPRLAEHQGYLLEHGRTPTTVREVLKDLSGILQVAAEHGLMPHGNPVRSMRKVPLPARDEVNPLTPAELEAILAVLQGRDRAIALLAGHLGLRPREARLAPWHALDGRTLLVGRGRAKGGVQRTISVPAVTAHELKQWRLEAGRPGDDEPIVGPMAVDEMKKWSRTLRAAARRAGVKRPDIVLYTLRHTHASALHYCGYTVPAAARRMGHSGKEHLSTYAHVIDALGDKRYSTLDALITAARAELEFPVSSRTAR
jgi:integrase